MYLSDKQLADYEEFGFLDSIPILSAGEVRHFREEVDKTGGNGAKVIADAEALIEKYSK